MTWMPGSACTGCSAAMRARLISRAGGVASGVRDAVAVVPALAGQQDLAGGVAVELRAEGDELAHARRALGDQRGDRLDVAEADPGHQGVVQVLLRGVGRVHGGGDPALRPGRRALVEHRLGDEQDGVDLRPQPQRGGQPGDARADHDDVASMTQPGRRGVQPAREVQRVGHEGGRPPHPRVAPGRPRRPSATSVPAGRRGRTPRRPHVAGLAAAPGRRSRGRARGTSTGSRARSRVRQVLGHRTGVAGRLRAGQRAAAEGVVEGRAEQGGQHPAGLVDAGVLEEAAWPARRGW